MVYRKRLAEQRPRQAIKALQSAAIHTLDIFYTNSTRKIAPINGFDKKNISS
jgi:hypothetical protein